MGYTANGKENQLPALCEEIDATIARRKWDLQGAPTDDLPTCAIPLINGTQGYIYYDSQESDEIVFETAKNGNIDRYGAGSRVFLGQDVSITKEKDERLEFTGENGQVVELTRQYRR